MKLLEKIKAAKRVSVPLLVVQTPDPQATMRAISGVTNGSPLVQWDIVRGAMGYNSAGTAMLAKLVGGYVDEAGQLPVETREKILEASGNPTGMLQFAEGFSEGAILFYLNAHRYLDTGPVAQAIWNLREPFKQNNRMVIFLAPSVTLPSELKNDVVVLDEPLPVDAELEKIIVDTYESAGVKVPSADKLLKAVDAVAGLAAFSAEQSAAMAMGKSGLDLEELGAQKRQQVAGVPGASLWAGRETFKDIVGLANIKGFLSKLLSNKKERIRETVFLDEVDKMVAGSGDSSGVSQAMNEQFLSWTQNSRVMGVLLCGVPGAGKSATVKAASGEYNLPCLMASLTAVKGSLVGQSEQNIKTLFKTADAIAGSGRILMIATCNQMSALTPEIMARFRLGTFFYSYPADDERAALWEYYRKRFNVEDTKIPESTNWVGREIESCCELSYLLDVSLAQASKKIVPVCKAQSAKITQLQRECSGRFIDASLDRIYTFDEGARPNAMVNPQGGRQIALS